MKILIAHNYYRQPGGEDSVLRSEVALLKEMGHEVYVLERSNTELNSYDILKKLQFLFSVLWSSRSYNDVKRIIREFKPDVAHFHNLFFMLTPSVYIACKEEKVPVVQSLHNFRLLCANGLYFRNNKPCEECSPRSFWPGIKYRCYYNSYSITAVVAGILSYHWRRRTWNKWVDCFITSSEFSRQKFVNAGLPADKIIVKPNFVASEQKRTQQEGTYALYVGRLSEEKGVRVLVQAWQNLPNIPLKIMGDGPLGEELKSFIRAKNITNVEFLGYTTTVEYQKYMQGAKFMIMPTLCYENFPRVIAEAFSYGIPVVASRIGSIGEIVKDRETGVLFNSADADDLAEKVRWVCQQNGELNRMSQKAKQVYTEKYSATPNYGQLMASYANAAKNASVSNVPSGGSTWFSFWAGLSTFDFSHGFKRYSKNTAYLLLEKVMRILISMVVWAFVARHLGAEHFGIFNFALSFVFLFKVIADLGLDDLVVRELVKNEKRKDEILGTSFMLKLIGSTLAIITIVLVTKFLSVDAETKLAVIIISLRLIFQSFSVIDFYFQSKVLSKFVVFSQILGLTAIAILCPIFVFLKLPLIYFVYVIVLESVLNALGLAVFYAWQRNNLFQWKFNFDLCKSLFKDVWPLLVSGIAVSIYMRIDQIMIKHMMDATSVGYYAAAVRISEAFFFIPVIISTSLFPTIVSTKLNDEKLFYEKLQALFAILFWVALFLSVALSLLSQPIILLLYGEEYLPAAAVLAIHIWSSIFIFIGDGRYKWSVSENLQIYTMYYTLTGAVTNIVLNLLLIPAMGIKGAAIATVIAQFVACVLSSAFSRKTRKIFFLQLKSFSSLPLSLKFIMKEI